METLGTLLLCLSIAAGLSALAPFYTLLLLALIGAAVPAEWVIGGIQLDLEDIAIFFLVLALVTRARGSLYSAWRQLPFRHMWLLLVVLSALAYGTAPINFQYFTSVHSAAYQIYRYSIRGLLFYPLAAFLLTDQAKVRRALGTLLVVANYSAILSVQQGWQNLSAGGLFDRNHVGSVYLLPILWCLAVLIFVKGDFSRLICASSLALMLRSLLYAGSRGSWGGVTAGTAVLISLLSSKRQWRSRLVRWSAVAVVVFCLVLALKPDLFDRPNVKRVFTMKNPAAEETFNWRREVAWPHFWNLALESPWLGRGMAYDLSLGRNTNTPHSTYLGIAVSRGFPVLLLYLLFTVITIGAGLKMSRTRAEPWRVLAGLLGASYLVGIWVHGIVETLLDTDFILSVFWSVQGVVLCQYVLSSRSKESDPAEPETGGPPTRG